MHAHEEALAKNLRDIDVCNDQVNNTLKSL